MNVEKRAGFVDFSASENHLVIVESEVVAELVDDGVADLAPRLRARARDAHDRAAEDRDLVGKRRRDAEDAEQLLVVVDEIEVVVGRLFLDDHGDVLDERRETIGQLVECFFDELPEFVR
jgi:hypothetical protein